ncbi:Glycoside hydrolase family 17-like protein, partial [Globisporangium splendens]
MKTGGALLLSAFLAALCGSSYVAANGVCYDPSHVGVGTKNADSVAADIATIKSKGFTYVRTYISKFGNTLLAKQLAESGLQVTVGVPYGQGDYADQLEAAVSAASNGNVVYVMIGNENLANMGSVPADFIQEIKKVKARIPNVKVGTVQRNTEFLNKIGGLSDLVAACDVIGVNIHPFFTPGQTGANAMELTKKHWDQIKSTVGDKLFLGETGWPSSGSIYGNSGSVDSASAYYSAYKSWSAGLPADKKYYFQLFDQPYRSEAYEQTYGILTSGGQDKFGGVSVTPVTVAPVATTSAPAPAATTSAPTPASTPAPTSSSPSSPSSAPSSSPSSAPSPSPSTSSGSKSSTSSATSSSAGSSTGGAAVDSSSTTGSRSYGSGYGSAAGVHLRTGSSSSATSSEKAGGEQDSAAVAAAAAYVPGARTSVNTPSVNASDSTSYTSGKGSTTETNTQSSGSGSATSVVFAVAAGCAAVLGAFGFIYQTRKKAQKLEEEENKMSFTVTPMGGREAAL